MLKGKVGPKIAELCRALADEAQRDFLNSREELHDPVLQQCHENPGGPPSDVAYGGEIHLHHHWRDLEPDKLSIATAR